jgi:hypothetical protein
MKTIMNPKHPRWDEFCERLAGSEGCNFKEDKDGNTTWKCNGGYDKSYAIRILQTMPEIDIEKTLKYFDSHGGHCDCEILFNIGWM